MIPQSQLSKLSNRLLKKNGGRRIPEHILERDYCIAWFLTGLARTPLRDKLVFKGGTALRRCHFADYRFSEDLDFTLLQPHTFEEIKLASNITFQFSRVDSVSHKNSYTFYLLYEGPLPATSTPKEIKVDITINECVHFDPEELPILKSCDEFTDLPDHATILVYSLDEIAAEKTVALHDRARTEPRDLYDIWYLTEETGSVDLDDCIAAIHAKLAHRNKTPQEVSKEFQVKEPRLMKTWETRLSAQVTNHVNIVIKISLLQLAINYYFSDC